MVTFSVIALFCRIVSSEASQENLLTNRESIKMSTISLGEFTEKIETQFEELGLTLERLEDDLAWFYFYQGTHRATIKAVIYPATSYAYIQFVVESYSAELNANGLYDGKVWSNIDSVELAIVQLLKVIGEIKRESLSA